MEHKYFKSVRKLFKSVLLKIVYKGDLTAVSELEHLLTGYLDYLENKQENNYGFYWHYEPKR